MKHYLDFPSWIRPEIIPGLPFHWYGLMYIIVIVLTYILFRYQVKKDGFQIEKSEIEDFFTWLIIGALLGARLVATLIFSPPEEFLFKPWRIVWPFHEGNFVGFAGMSYYGGVIGLIISFLIFTRIKKWNGLKITDYVFAGFPIAYTFGRFGNFINGELFGRVTTKPWGMVFPYAQKFPISYPWVREVMNEVGMVPKEIFVNLPRHPSQLYEAFLEGILLWILIWFVARRFKKFDGFITSVYILGYGTLRFFVDYFRMPYTGEYSIKLSKMDNPPYLLQTPWNFTLSQVFSFSMIVGGAIMLFVLYKKYKKGQEASSR